ncbi:MAG: antitoxin Xre/MbcA/ParS toxin-binding domain-containing protein [Salinivirgaceae bacterium]
MKAEQISLSTLDNRNVLSLIETSRNGVDLDTFDEITGEFPFDLSDWSRILHISERTIQRYRKDKRKFDSIHTDRLLQIMILLNKGIEVFGNTDNFLSWLNSLNIALGSIKPIELLDNSFGINMVTNELIKIEYGVLA